MEDIMKVLRALCDETRLRMLMLIEREELCVCEVMYILNMHQSRVSRHLNILRDAGLAKARRQGTWMYYSSSTSTPHCFRVVEALRNWLKDTDIVKSDLIRLEECIANRGKNGYCPVPSII